jgi:hypothetical protein
LEEYGHYAADLLEPEPSDMENVSNFLETGAEWLDLKWRGVCYSCLILFVLVVLLLGRMHFNVRRLEQMDEMEQTRRLECAMTMR